MVRCSHSIWVPTPSSYLIPYYTTSFPGLFSAEEEEGKSPGNEAANYIATFPISLTLFLISLLWSFIKHFIFHNNCTINTNIVSLPLQRKVKREALGTRVPRSHAWILRYFGQFTWRRLVVSVPASFSVSGVVKKRQAISLATINNRTKWSYESLCCRKFQGFKT